MTDTSPDKTDATPELAKPTTSWSSFRRDLLRWIDQLAPLLMLVLVVAFFVVAIDLQRGSMEDALRFIGDRSIESIVRQTAIVGTAALGMTIVIIAGGIDLSVGSIIALVTVVIAYVLQHVAPETAELGVMWPILAMLAGVAAGAMAGLGNGLVITRAKVVPFIVTLGSLLIFRGIAKGIANEQKIDAPRTWLNQLLASSRGEGTALDSIALVAWIVAGLLLLGGLWALARMVMRFMKRGDRSRPAWARLAMNLGCTTLVLGLGVVVWLASRQWPVGVWIMVYLAVLVAAMLRFTALGRHIYAIGSNEQTARLCGVGVNRVKLIVYSLGGLFAGLGGLMQFSRLTVGDPTVAFGLELDVIAAVVIGGGSLNGGKGSILGTIVGALLMMVIRAGCTNLGVSNWVQEITTGLIIVAAVALDRLRHRGAA